MALVTGIESGVNKGVNAVTDSLGIVRLAVDADVTIDDEFKVKTDIIIQNSTTLASALTTTIDTWTIGVAKLGRLRHILLAGTRGGKFSVKFNGSVKYIIRTNGPDTKLISFDRIKFIAGDTVSVEVTNDSGKSADYDMTIEGYEV